MWRSLSIPRRQQVAPGAEPRGGGVDQFYNHTSRQSVRVSARVSVRVSTSSRLLSQWLSYPLGSLRSPASWPSLPAASQPSTPSPSPNSSAPARHLFSLRSRPSLPGKPLFHHSLPSPRACSSAPSLSPPSPPNPTFFSPPSKPYLSFASHARAPSSMSTGIQSCTPFSRPPSTSSSAPAKHPMKSGAQCSSSTAWASKGQS